MTTLLAVDDLRVGYGSIAALRGVSLTVAEGEVVAVIGPNGAGKSTLLLTVAGIVRAQAGAVAFSGRPMLGRPPEELVADGLSLVPEGRHIFASLSVEENIRIGATARRDGAAEIALDVERMVALFPILGERFAQRAGKLSGGEQQMLAIARALMGRPRLLLLDEPSLGLAPLIVDQVYRVIGELRRQGLTVLLVEQSVHRALAAADRTYLMSNGLLRFGGQSAELAGAADFEDAYFGAGAAEMRP